MTAIIEEAVTPSEFRTKRERRANGFRGQWLTLLLIFVFLVLHSSPGKSATPALRQTDLATLCADGSDIELAKRGVVGLASAVKASRREDDLKEIKAELHELLRSKCFALAVENARLIEVMNVDSLAAFKTWWQNGGEDWLSSYARPRRPRPTNIVVPPDIVETVVSASKTGAGSAGTSALACAVPDSSCGIETRSFRRRFEIFFQEISERERTMRKEEAAGGGEPCRKLPDPSDYAQWRNCVEANRPLVPALPIGETRAPHEGWLILVARAEEDACEEKRIYDLASGKAYFGRNCAGKKKPSPAASPTEGRSAIRGGVVSLEMLRETVWMLVLADQVQLRQVESYSVQLPPSVDPTWATSSRARGFEQSTQPAPCSEDGGTTWRWMVHGKVVARGNLCSMEGTPGGRYANDLVEVFESGLRSKNDVASLPKELRGEL